MTTVDKAHAVFMSFKGRSPRQIYIDACAKRSAKVNSRLRDFLSDEVDDFYNMTELDVSGNYLGPKGCLAVLDIVRCQQKLSALSLSGCGAEDQCCTDLVDILQDHPQLRDVDLSDNPDITVYSGKCLVHILKLNVNIVNMNLERTHIGANVAGVLKRMCRQNASLMEDYFCDEYFRMKDMFVGLDVDGSGWVNLMTLKQSVVFPLVQDRLETRIKKTKPKKREDNCVDVNTFMELTYLSYKTLEELKEYAACADSEDAKPELTLAAPDEYTYIKKNWVAIVKELTARDASCEELSRFRIRDSVWSSEAIGELCAKAVDLARKELKKEKEQKEGKTQKEEKKKTATVKEDDEKKKEGDDDENVNTETTETTTTGENKKDEAEEEKEKEEPEEEKKKPVPTKEDEEEDDDQFEDDGPVTLTAKHLYDAFKAIGGPKEQRPPRLRSFLDDREEKEPKKPWNVPPSIVAAIVKIFDGAKPQGIVAQDVLSSRVETPLETLKLTVLKPYFTKYSIPVELALLTLTETVNMVDEHYEAVRLGRNIPTDTIKAYSV